jgi:3-hydroxyacyl-CoA dehydrogenase/3a,7a,12a-trihydroxy-5b-cholest-24-enoyl-CoA hydratase
MKLFGAGKLKVSGNLMASQKLAPILQKVDPKDVMAAAQKRAGGAAPAAAPAAAAPAAPAADGKPNSADVFTGIAAFVAKQGAELTGKVKTVFQFKLKNPDAVYTIDLKNGAGSAGPGESAPPECTLEIADADFMDMVGGKADAMKLFTTGKLKITGNVMASQKLDFLRKIDPADVLAAAQKRAGGGAAAPSPDLQKAPAPAASSGTQAPAIVEKIARRIAENAGLVAEVGAVIELRVKDPANVYTIDLKHGAGGVKSGKPEQADVTLSLSDADLAALAASGGQLQSFYQHGRIRVDGDVRAAGKLGFLAELG